MMVQNLREKAMGTWGPGKFQSDSSSDFRDHLITELREFIESDILKASEDNVLERPTIGAVACLTAVLQETVEKVNRDFFLSPEQVRVWRDRYMAWLERAFVQADADSNFRCQSRDRARREFTRLLQCVE